MIKGECLKQISWQCVWWDRWHQGWKACILTQWKSVLLHWSVWSPENLAQSTLQLLQAQNLVIFKGSLFYRFSQWLEWGQKSREWRWGMLGKQKREKSDLILRKKKNQKLKFSSISQNPEINAVQLQRILNNISWRSKCWEIMFL